MGISRAEGNGLWELLKTTQLEPAELRGILRSLLPFHAEGWRSKKDVRALGVKALSDIQEATPEMITGEVQPKLPVMACRLLVNLKYQRNWQRERRLHLTIFCWRSCNIRESCLLIC